jgi:hypothetical protein
MFHPNDYINVETEATKRLEVRGSNIGPEFSYTDNFPSIFSCTLGQRFPKWGAHPWRRTNGFMGGGMFFVCKTIKKEIWRNIFKISWLVE